MTGVARVHFQSVIEAAILFVLLLPVGPEFVLEALYWVVPFRTLGREVEHDHA